MIKEATNKKNLWPISPYMTPNKNGKVTKVNKPGLASYLKSVSRATWCQPSSWYLTSSLIFRLGRTHPRLCEIHETHMLVESGGNHAMYMCTEGAKGEIKSQLIERSKHNGAICTLHCAVTRGSLDSLERTASLINRLEHLVGIGDEKLRVFWGIGAGENWFSRGVEANTTFPDFVLCVRSNH